MLQVKHYNERPVVEWCKESAKVESFVSPTASSSGRVMDSAFKRPASSYSVVKGSLQGGLTVLQG